jgi:hypothetical protein
MLGHTVTRENAMRKPAVWVALLAALLITGCVDRDDADAGGDLTIERRIGFAVVVDSSGGSQMIGFSTDRNDTSGEAFDITQAVWRVGDGQWNEPPVTCVGRGQRIELGVAAVQNEAQPGLLQDRVIWLSCLAPPEE